jgi:Integrase zinc binding domain
VCSRHYNRVEYLLTFQFELNVSSGERNAMSDALSRPRREKDLNTSNVVNIRNVNAKTKINLIEISRKREIYKVHNNTKYGHPGGRGTPFECLQDLEFQPTRSQVKDIVKRCQQCQKIK